MKWLIAIFIFHISVALQAQARTEPEMVYIKIEVKGLACPYCAYGMEKDLSKLAGVKHVDIQLKEGLAFLSVPTAQKPTREQIEAVIVDGGFTPGEIVFRSTPFKRE